MRTIITLLLSVITFTASAQVSQKNINTISGKLIQGIDTVYTDGRSLLRTVYSDGKEFGKYSLGKADTLLTKAGTTLNKATETVWEALVMQQKVKSIAILFSIIAYFLLIYFYRKQIGRFTLLKEDKYDSYTTHQHVFIWVGLSLLIFLGVFNTMHFTTMLTGFLNPNFGALKDLYEVGDTLLNKQ